MILVDTPGVHRPDSTLGRKMMGEVREALDSCDLILAMIDASRRPEPEERFLFELVSKSKTPAFLLAQ